MTGAGYSHAGPLSGLRVADLTIITAGASATQLLADFGADVVKVESATYPDPFRAWGSGLSTPAGLERPWDASPPFNAVNRNKRSLTLDLKQPAGREAFLKLVAISDVVAENFRRGVLDRLGLGYETLRQVKPDIILASFSSQGTTGPEAGNASYGSTLDALSGLMSMTGYSPDEPIWSSNEVNYPDQIVSVFGAGVILAGLRRRRLTGVGGHIDLAQRELVTSLIGEAVLDYAANGRIAAPRANRDATRVPHGCYRCRGEDEWLAVAVENDDQWAALCRAIGRPELADDDRYATLLGRWEHEAEIDGIVAGWAVTQEKRAAMAKLQAAGVPAAAVLNGAELLEDPQLAARGFYESVPHPIGGPQRQRTFPFQLSRTPGAIRGHAPCLGQHTREVLRDLLGYTDGQIDDLEAAGVVGYAPVGRRERSRVRA